MKSLQGESWAEDVTADGDYNKGLKWIAKKKKKEWKEKKVKELTKS